MSLSGERWRCVGHRLTVPSPKNWEGWTHVRAEFPDPENSGFRSFTAGCKSKDNQDGPVCNFDAKHL